MPSTQRLAPTQKISDDASYPQRPVTASAGHGGQVIAQPSAGRLGPPPAQHTSVPSSASPPRAISSAPTGQYGNAAPASSPPNGSAKQLPPRPRTSQLDDPSLSMPMVAQRPWGLIILVLLIDIGLGVAGVWMLNEGLGDKPSAGTTAPRSGASTTPASAVAASAAPGTPPGTPHTAATSTGLAPDTAPAAPNGSGAAAPTNGSAAAPAPPTNGSAAAPAAPTNGSVEPMATTGATRAAAQASAPPGAGSSAAAVDKPAKRHHTTVKQPGGTATASGPVDPYATSAPVPDRLPPESK